MLFEYILFKRKNVHTSVLCSAFTLTFKSISSRSTLGTLDKSVTCRSMNRHLEAIINFTLKDLQSFGGCKAAKVQSKRFTADCSLTNTPCKVNISWTKMASEIISYVCPKVAGYTSTPQLQGAFTHNHCLGTWCQNSLYLLWIYFLRDKEGQCALMTTILPCPKTIQDVVRSSYNSCGLLSLVLFCL